MIWIRSASAGGSGLSADLVWGCRWPLALWRVRGRMWRMWLAGGAIIAHRGASGACPENTLPAFREAWMQGADAIEGDFRLTRDGVVVGVHDRTLRRTGGVALEVAAATLEELRAVDVGRWRGASWAGARIPTLAEVLATVPAGRGAVLELKTGPEILAPMNEVLAASPVPLERIVLIAFDRRVAKQAKERFPAATVWWLADLRIAGGRLQPPATEILDTLKAVDADGVGVSDHDSLDAGFVGEVLDAGYGFNVWTVDDAQRARRLLDMGVQSITTNYPLKLRSVLGS